jgi:predicted membrane protein
MIDTISFLIFFIYILALLMILVYISPLLSALVMILVPLASVYLLPDRTIQFLSIDQFSFAGIPVQNIHILLLIWSALIGVVACTEFISWYLSIDKKPKASRQETPAPAPLKSGETPKSIKNKIEDFLVELGKIMSGKR